MKDIKTKKQSDCSCPVSIDKPQQNKKR